MSNSNGTPRGLENFHIGNKEKYKEALDKNETTPKTIIARLKMSVKKMISNFFWAAVILSVESLVIWILCKYVFPELQITFVKTLTALFIARLALRNVGEKVEIGK